MLSILSKKRLHYSPAFYVYLQVELALSHFLCYWSEISHILATVPLPLFGVQEGKETIPNLIRYGAFSFLYIFIGGKILYFLILEAS